MKEFQTGQEFQTKEGGNQFFRVKKINKKTVVFRPIVKFEQRTDIQPLQIWLKTERFWAKNTRSWVK